MKNSVKENRSGRKEIQIVPYSPTHARAFKELNEAWINKYFELEDDDIQTLSNPQAIIDKGGFIFVALNDDLPVGVCALRKSGDDTLEFSKMAVSENVQGLGIGGKLVGAAIAKAREAGAKRLYLEGNTLLEASIHLYRKFGFKEVIGRESHYKRVNIIMEMLLD